MKKEATLISAIEQELGLLQELTLQVQQLLESIHAIDNQNIRNGLVVVLPFTCIAFTPGLSAFFTILLETLMMNCRLVLTGTNNY